MDIKSGFESTKEFFSNLINSFIERIKDFVENLMEENRQLALILAGLVGLLFIFLILVVILLSNPEKKDNKKQMPVAPVVTGTEASFIPDEAKMPTDYNISRAKKSSWTKEESEEWFTIPSEKEIENLSNSNQRFVDEIIGAAP